MILIKIKTLIFAIFVILILANVHAYSEQVKTDIPVEKIKVRIKWEAVENAVNYRVLIRNSDGKIIINKATESNSIDLNVFPGKYSMRIGAVNKFFKIGSWSDWTLITVKKPEPPKKIVEKKVEKPERPYMPLKVGAGISYVYMLPELDKILDNTYLSGNLLISYGLGNLISFKFFRHIGFEAESSYTNIEGKDKVNGDSIDKTDILAGGNLFITTGFNFPVNLVIRAGGGIAFTKLEYKGSSNTTTINSQDSYYKLGSAVEFAYSHFFAEIGADYNTIMYIGDQFKALTFTMRTGVRF